MQRSSDLSKVLTAVLCAAVFGGCATEADDDQASTQSTLAREDDGAPWISDVSSARDDDDGDAARRPSGPQRYPEPLGPVSIVVARPPSDRSDSVKVLDVIGRSVENRGALQLWTASNKQDNGNQKWLLHPRGNAFIIENVNSGKCLDESRDTPLANGNKVYQYDCSNVSPNQRWEFVGRRGGFGALRNELSGRCLDLSGLDYRDGASVQVWDCSGSWNQSWNIW